jgi:biotin transport system substrate-specific component
MRRVSRPRGSTVLWPGAFLSAFIGGIGVVYAFGITGLAVIAHLSWVQAAVASAVFIPGDLLKCAICAALVQTVARGLPHWRLAD